MREILFRGKRIDNGEWTYGYYVEAKHRWHKYGIHKEWIVCSAAANGGWFALHEKHAVKDSTVGEYTGMTDKNGKKIFEGDICLVKSPRGTYSYTMRVAWDSSFFNGWVGSMYATDEESTRYCEQAQFEQFTDYEAKCCEVIGNAYDNPELLEESNES